METLSNFLTPFIFIGAEGILIDGIKRVKKWDNENIEAISGKKVITISGKGLKMEHKTLDSLLIRGKVDKIEFRTDAK